MNNVPMKPQTSQLIQAAQFTPDQMKLITDTVAKGATPDELKLFLYRCANMQLDPLKPGQIHFVKYSNGPGTIVVGIEGFRSIAGRTGKLSGVKRGVNVDDNGKLIGGWAEVYRSDWKEPAREEVPFEEFNTGKGPWAKMPQTMIKKVAEAAALRMAFPDVLGGIYETSEMDQAQDQSVRIVPTQPEPGDGFIPEQNSYLINFGKWNKRPLEQIYNSEGPGAIASYIQYLENTALKTGKPLGPQALEFIDQASAFLGAMENAPLS